MRRTAKPNRFLFLMGPVHEVLVEGPTVDACIAEADREQARLERRYGRRVRRLRSGPAPASMDRRRARQAR